MVEDKLISAIIDKFTKHLKCEEFLLKEGHLLNSYKANYELPPIIVSSNIELKLILIDIAK